MKLEVSHEWKDESIESKIEWFLQKTTAERLQEAFQDARLVQQIIKFEEPDDRSTFKTFKILKR